MIYYTGYFGLTQYTDKSENSVGLGDKFFDYFKDKDKYTAESDDSVLKDYGIKEVVLMPEGGVAVCANHTRVYLDFLINKQFKDLTGLFEYAYKDYNVLHKIFEICSRYGLYTKEVASFLNNEFGSLFRSYILAINDKHTLHYIIGN